MTMTTQQPKRGHCASQSFAYAGGKSVSGLSVSKLFNDNKMYKTISEDVMTLGEATQATAAATKRLKKRSGGASNSKWVSEYIDTEGHWDS